VSEQLQISKDTLRYYDKLRLVCPKRGENNYRYYTAEDMLDLQYIQVLSFTGFTLAEINQLFHYMKACDESNFPLLLELMKKKKENLVKKSTVFQYMIEYINETEVVYSKKSAFDVSKINALAINMFHVMNELRKEQKS